MKKIPFLLFIFAFMCSCNDSFSGDVIPFISRSEPDIDVRGVQLYVSPDGSNSNAGSSEKAPLKTIQQAIYKAKPGTTINVMPGTYYASRTALINMRKENSGESENPIIIKAYNSANPPKLRVTEKGIWNCININASYVIIDGLELYGNNTNINLKDAEDNAKLNHDHPDAADINTNGFYNTNGITIGGPRDQSSYPVHVTIRYCIIHDFPGAGVTCIQTDYITFENNTVYNNCWYMMYAGSGLSILNPFNSDESTDYKNFVIGNTCYNNKCLVPWLVNGVLRYSDGNGIIIDTNKKPYAGSPLDGKQGEYTGRTLVANNISFGNGGSGIHAFEANHVDIINNTAFPNTQKMKNYAEIFSNDGRDNNIVNNIMYAQDDGNYNSKAKNPSEVYSHNVYFNGKVVTRGEGDIVAAPLFVNSVLDLKKADFHLKAGSKAIGVGMRTSYMPTTDKDGVQRDSGIDAGALQYTQGNSTKIKNIIYK